MISVSNAKIIKDGRNILDNISLEISASRVGIIGDNGSGKSTFARSLNGLEKLSSGEIKVYGKEPNTYDVGFVFQNPDNQIIFPIIAEDLAYGLKKSGLSKSEIQARIDHTLNNFSLSNLKTRRSHELSGGEKQLISLIGVLLMSPKIIVFDEPTTLLDLRNRTKLIKVIKSLPQQCIIVSHDLDFMTGMDQLIWIEDGRVRAIGRPEDILSAYREASNADR